MYELATSTPAVDIAESWKLMFRIVYGLEMSRRVTANPRELKLSGVRLKNGAISVTPIIREALITEGVKAEIIQNKNRNMMHVILRTFSGILRNDRSAIKRPHHRDVCKPETAKR